MFIVSDTVLGTQETRVNKMYKNLNPCVTSSYSGGGRDRFKIVVFIVQKESAMKRKGRVRMMGRVAVGCNFPCGGQAVVQ